MRNTCQTLYFNPNKHVWKYNRKHWEKSVLKTTPSPQGVTLKYSDLPSYFISCGFVYLLGIFYLTLNSNQPNRKRHLKIILTKWVVTGGESKAELSTTYFHRQWKPGILLSKAGTHYRSFNWPWLGSNMEAEWLFLILPVVNPAVGTLKLSTSLPGRYSNLSCSSKLIIFTNVLSPNLLIA